MSDYILPSTFNRRITVKRADTTADDAGGTSNDGFTTRFTTWASVDEMDASRKTYYGIDLFQDAWEITLRYLDSRTFNTADLIDYAENMSSTITLSVKAIHTVQQNYKRFTVLICFNSDLS